MTFVEFYDKTSIENVCACFAGVPDRVILVGGNRKLLEKHCIRYQSIFEDRGDDIEFLYKSINKNKMSSIVNALCEIVEEYPDCVFDLTGGDDLVLVAVGIVHERYKDRNIQMHRFNILSNSIIDCDGDGDTVFEGEFPSISIQENIRIYGGDIVFEDQKPGGTYEWDCDKYFRADVNKMWEICKEDIRLWNTQLGVLAAAERYRDEWQAPMTTVASVDKITAYLSQKKSKFIFAKSFLAKLQKAGLITDYYCDERNLTVSYKNEQVKRCLVKAGQVLEMKIYLAALDACEQDGSYTYYDVLNGVNIDWDGDIHTDDEVYDTQNEIDVIMMKGMIPVFVSCKNGTVDISELYKLDSVAEAFGGRYAKKVLVTTSLETMTDFEGYFRQRAKDMNIRIVDNVQYMSEAELEKEIKTFWNIT